MKTINTVGDLIDVLSLYGRGMPINFTTDGQAARLATDLQVYATYFIDQAKTPRLDINLFTVK